MAAGRCATFIKTMTKKILLLFVILFLNYNSFSQSDYFLGKRTYCDMPNQSDSRELYKLGIDCINQNLYIGGANQVFQKLIKQDSLFCDAYFFAGYTFRLSNMNKEAFAMYYMADSLSQNKSIEFKQNLAMMSVSIGNMRFARKKYLEMTKYFPTSPEGYYGIAITSPEIGDADFGLKNINIAEEKYVLENKDVQFIKAILLNLTGNYEDSIKYFEKVQSEFSKNDYFNGNYALSLYEIAIKSNDDKLLKKAKKHYNKVKDKSNLTDYIKSKFEKP